MERRSLGPLSVSAVGLGCNNFGSRLDQAATTRVVHAALDAGVTFFDTADIYGATNSEVYLGTALRDRRDEATIASKFGMPLDDTHYGAAPDYVRRACDASLSRLGIDTIDLYQLHAPDPSVPITDTLGALSELIDAGKVRAIGCSNFSAAQLDEASAAAGAGHRFVSVQNQYSLLWREPEESVLPACNRLGIGFLPYYPLANGLLTGKYRAGQPIPDGTRLSLMDASRAAHWLSPTFFDAVEALLGVGEESGVPITDVAFAWLLSHRQVASVIAGASTPEQIRANAEASRRVLDPALLARIDELTNPAHFTSSE